MSQYTNQVLFVTSAPISANPRLIKELDFYKKSYTCTLVTHKPTGWTEELDGEWLQQNDGIATYEFSSSRSPIIWFFLKVLHKICLAFRLYKLDFIALKVLASSPQAFLIRKLVKNLPLDNYDEIIVHTYSAISTLALMTNKFQSKKIRIDVEDYHPGEKAYWNEYYESHLRIQIMQKAFNYAKNITYAAPLIEKRCLEIFDFDPNTKHKTILNSFPQAEFKPPKRKESGKIKCVWFSQHINHSRGLDSVLQDVKKFPNIELHLIGVRHENYVGKFDLGDNVIFHNPMSQAKLHGFLADMDVGLALETEGADENRKICLTNKIMAYAQAGLYIMATKTKAQTKFLQELPGHGQITRGLKICSELNEIPCRYFEIDSKLNRFDFAKQFSWECESNRLAEIV